MACCIDKPHSLWEEGKRFWNSGLERPLRAQLDGLLRELGDRDAESSVGDRSLKREAGLDAFSEI